MIATITLNPSIDVIYLMNNFELGKENRAPQPHRMAGGKGINAGRTLALLGAPVLALGLLAGNAGEMVEGFLEAENHFILQMSKLTSGETRTSTTIMHNDDVQTMIVENGPLVTEKELKPLFYNLVAEREKLSLIVISGSVTTEDDFLYSKLIHFIRENVSSTIPIFLDASGLQLETVVHKASDKPNFIKPNEDELAELVGKKIANKKEAIKELHSALFADIPHILVSLGGKGAVAKINDKFYDIQIPKIPVVNTTGSGDATVGGFAYALDKNLSAELALKYAMACGMSNAQHEEVGFVAPEQVEEFVKQIEVVEAK